MIKKHKMHFYVLLIAQTIDMKIEVIALKRNRISFSFIDNYLGYRKRSLLIVPITVNSFRRNLAQSRDKKEATIFREIQQRRYLRKLCDLFRK